MNYYNQYIQFLKPERRISNSLIKPLNIYRISTYNNGNPPTKSGSNYRYVFATGIWENKLHCFQFNEIKPSDFIEFLNRIIDKRKKITESTTLRDVVKKFPLHGRPLFTRYLKTSPNIYGRGLRNYRTYHISEIRYVYLVQFEQEVLMDVFKLLKVNKTIRREIIKEDLEEND
jgi:hypothetical protein